MTPLEDIKIYAYLAPDPLDDDSHLEEEWISWLPGYKTGDTEEGLPSFYHEENIELYEKIENYIIGIFRSALTRMWPLMDGIYIKQIQIAIDFMNFKNSDALAGYDSHKSNPAKGSYVFHVDQDLLNRYLHYFQGNEKAIPNMNLWEHELIHLLDHWQIVESRGFFDSNLPQNNLQYYLLKYRSEGLANLFDLLDGKLKTIQSREEANEKFQNIFSQVQPNVLSLTQTSREDRIQLYSGYDFYEIGPWIMLDMVDEILSVSELPDAEELEEKLSQGVSIPDETKLEILKMAFYIDNDWFLGKIPLKD